MHEIQENILNQFKSFILKNEITLIEQTVINATDVDYYYYSVPYSPSIANFIASLTGVSYDFIKQYVFTNQFLILLKDFDNVDIQINLVFEGNTIDIDFRHNNGFNFIGDINDIGFLSMGFHCLDTSSISDLNFTVHCSRSLLVNPDDYELYYMDTLAKINQTLDKSITTFKQVLDLSKKTTVDVLNSRLDHSDFKVVSIEDFQKFYGGETSKNFLSEDFSVSVNYQTFNYFLKKYYSPAFAHKLKSIASLSSFQEKFLKRNIDWHSSVINDFTIIFNHISKYEEFNNIHTICFGAMPNKDYRCSLILNDDGTVDFCTEENVWLHDLDSIYNYIKEDFILKMERHLNVDREDIRLPHLKVYEMVVL